ncbi:MAG: DUF2797 domain-containing protein [Flavobacteriaceae bacterium]|nr:DUF2797 domain-containing protein [Flavobacteriaceae bacterium]
MFSGVLKKMITEYNSPITYFLDFKNDFLVLNQILNKNIEIILNGYECLNCKSDEIIFRQGFCKKCFYNIPDAGEWLMRPELSTAHLNLKDRNLEYEKIIQLQPHIIYLALSSHVKVGITRSSQIPNRWIDQGAHEAIAIAEVPNRYLSGVGEVALKEHFSDKTNWRKMLQNEFNSINWNEYIEKAKTHIPNELQKYLIKKILTPTKIKYPLNKSPKKVKSLNLKKEKTFKGELKGIKGQYLIFDDDTVFNIRANEGLVVKINLS